MAGVGVVFKLTQAISQKLELEEKEFLKYLDIVCIGTISDIVPLVDENRVIVKLGLKLVEQTGHSTVIITDDGTASGKFLGIVTNKDYRLSRDNQDEPIDNFMTKKKM